MQMCIIMTIKTTMITALARIISSWRWLSHHWSLETEKQSGTVSAI